MKALQRCTATSLLVGLAAMAGMPSAWAGFANGAVIVYAPAAASGAVGTASIPTLSEWGMIATAVLVAVMAYRSLRGRLGGKTVASVLLAGVITMAGSQQPGLIRTARAVPVQTELSNPAGGMADVQFLTGADVPVVNTSGVAQRIVSVTPQPPYPITQPAGSPRCVANLQLAPNATCYVRFDLPD